MYDFNEFVVVYCIKSKSEAYECFFDFYGKKTNLTGKKLQYLECDNGTEYLNKNFYEFTKQQGIII